MPWIMRHLVLAAVLFACAGCVLPSAFDEAVPEDGVAPGDTHTADEADSHASDLDDDTSSGDTQVADTTGAEVVEPEALSWWQPQWTRRTRVTVLPFGDGTAPLTDVPVHLRVRIASGSTSKHAAIVDAIAGAGLRVVDATHTTQLATEIEYASPTDCDMWVRLPSVIPARGTFFWLYWNGPESLFDEDHGPVWDKHFVGVWHMVLKGASGAEVVPGSVGTADLEASASCQDHNAELGRGVSCGEGGLETTLTTLPTQDFTLEVTFDPSFELSSPDVLLETPAYALRLVPEQESHAVQGSLTIAAGTTPATSPPLQGTSTTYTAFVRSGAAAHVWSGEARGAEANVGLLPQLPGTTLLLGWSLAAELDEVRVSNIARPADYLRLQALQADDDALRYGPWPDGATAALPVGAGTRWFPEIEHPADGHVVVVPILARGACNTFQVEGLGLANWEQLECIESGTGAFALHVWAAWGTVQPVDTTTGIFELQVTGPSEFEAIARVVPFAGPALHGAAVPIVGHGGGVPVSAENVVGDLQHALDFARSADTSPLVYVFAASQDAAGADAWEQTSRADEVGEQDLLLGNLVLLVAYGLAAPGRSASLVTGTGLAGPGGRDVESVGVVVELAF